MTFTTFLFAFLWLVLGLVLGLAFGKRFVKNLIEENNRTEDKCNELASDLRNAELETKISQNKFFARQQELEELREKNRKLEKIAKTHMLLKPPGTKTDERVLWVKRRFNDTPEQNLKDLTEDLQKYAGKRLKLSFTLIGKGGWRDIIREKHTKIVEKTLHTYSGHHTHKAKEPTHRIEENHLRFEGTPERIVRSIHTHLTDKDFGLVELSEQPTMAGTEVQKFWRDPDSPQVWFVNLSELVEEECEPKVQFVEVAVLDPHYEYVEVPVPYVSDVLPGKQDDLHALVEGIIEAREAARGDELAKQIEQLAEVKQEVNV